jgi:hypothetical protein
MVAAWHWEIRSSKGRIVAKGTYPARLYACPGDIALEQLAIYVGREAAPRVQRRWPTSQPSLILARVARGLVCEAWRGDDPDVRGEASGNDWIATAAAQPPRPE